MSDIIGTILYNEPEYEVNFLKINKKNQKKPTFSGFLAWLDQYI